MILARIVSSYDWPVFLQQTPRSTGVWHNVRFTLDAHENPDYVLILNHLVEPLKVCCDPRNVWTVIQEPPDSPVNQRFGDGFPAARVYTTAPEKTGPRFRLTPPYVPWLVEKDYDSLVSNDFPDKSKGICCITSNKAILEGHRKRLQFIQSYKDFLGLDLYGRGFDPIDSKWEVLSQYRYALVIENHRNPYYWTEKLADCFLAGVFPFYAGCTRVDQFFPKEAFWAFDLDDEEAAEKMREAMQEDLYGKSIPALQSAKRAVLDREQFFPFFSKEIERHAQTMWPAQPKEIVLQSNLKTGRAAWLKSKIKQILK